MHCQSDKNTGSLVVLSESVTSSLPDTRCQVIFSWSWSFTSSTSVNLQKLISTKVVSHDHIWLYNVFKEPWRTSRKAGNLDFFPCNPELSHSHLHTEANHSKAHLHSKCARCMNYSLSCAQLNYSASNLLLPFFASERKAELLPIHQPAAVYLSLPAISLIDGLSVCRPIGLMTNRWFGDGRRRRPLALEGTDLLLFCPICLALWDVCYRTGDWEQRVQTGRKIPFMAVWPHSCRQTQKQPQRWLNPQSDKCAHKRTLLKQT